MKTSPADPATIDEYIAAAAEEVRPILRKVRATIRQAAPGAQEAIKYRLPTFVLDGNLVHFGAFKDHLGLYPTPSATAKFKKELSAYEGAKGSIRFPLDQPIPYDLIRKIVEFRVRETREKTASKGKKR